MFENWLDKEYREELFKSVSFWLIIGSVIVLITNVTTDQSFSILIKKIQNPLEIICFALSLATTYVVAVVCAAIAHVIPPRWSDNIFLTSVLLMLDSASYVISDSGLIQVVAAVSFIPFCVIALGALIRTVHNLFKSETVEILVLSLVSVAVVWPLSFAYFSIVFSL